MVEKMILSDEAKQAISAAVTSAEKRTSVEIAVVVTPFSDTYQGYALVYGFAFGTAICCALYWFKIQTHFPLLVPIQAGMMALFATSPVFREIVVSILPQKIREAHAARRASQEFMHLAKHVPSNRPVVLLYVSLVEKYAHILHSRAVAEKIPAGNWDKIIAEFTMTIKATGLKDACLGAITRTASTLEPFFPDNGEENVLEDGVVEKE